MEFLLNSKMFCYPHYFYCKKEVLKENLDSLGDEFRVLFQNYFNTDFKFSFTKYLESFSKIYNSFSYLVKKVQRDNKILYFIQDCDYLNDRVLFSNVCKANNIPTIAFDHSIQIYDHLFYNNFSDYRITWGEYQINRIKKLSNNTPKKLINGGKPNYPFSIKRINYKKNHKWIYFLPAFQEASMQSVHRSLLQTEINIMEIQNIIFEKYKNIKLLIKPHPSDESKIFHFSTDLVNDSLDILTNEMQVAFVEDSTISFELLNYEIPVVYFADKLNNDNLHLKKLASDYVFVAFNDNLENKITKALTKKIDPFVREKIFNYYFGESKNFENCMNEIMVDVISKKNGLQ